MVKLRLRCYSNVAKALVFGYGERKTEGGKRKCSGFSQKYEIYRIF